MDKFFHSLRKNPFTFNKVLDTYHINAGMESTKNGYIMISRYLSNRTNMESNHNYINYFDKNFVLLKQEKLEIDGLLEDARIILHRNRYLVFWTYNAYKQGYNKVAYSYLDNIQIRLLESPVVRINDENWSPVYEKNWSPFIWNNRVFLIYTIDPHIIFELNPENGQIIDKWESNRFDWQFRPRGGTPAVLHKSSYITFFHSQDGCKNHCRTYEMGAYIFENKPPWKILRYSKEPIQLPEHFYEKNLINGHKKVIFPCGLINTKSQFIVSCGVNDTYTKIIKFDHRTILENMI